MKNLKNLKKQKGLALIEYALIGALVSVLLIIALTALQGGLSGLFNDVITAL